jgi:hypothetical protein
VRKLTRRTRGRSLAQIIEELSRYLTGVAALLLEAEIVRSAL